MSYHGDIRLGDTIDIKFVTTAATTGAPTQLAGTPVISAYPGNSTTQITAGITLTVDFDTVTGLNNVRVVATSGNGYATATNYALVITTGTVGGTSAVGYVVGTFSIENRSALMPTTATRTLDVSAGGEAGVDWANVGSPTTSVSLTGTTVATATNLTNERGKYALGSVWIGPSVNTNTTSYVDGIITNPVSTIAAAKTIADALNMRRFEVIRTGTVQIGADLTGYRLGGVGWSLTTTGGSRDTGTSVFHGASVTGGTFASTTGTINWEDCEFDTGVTVGVSDMLRCLFGGTLTLSTAGNYNFVDCASAVAGATTPVFAVPAGTVNISFRRWSGGIRITGITSGTTISIDMVSGGTVTLEGADGNVQVRGMASAITDSRTGTPTLGTTAVCNQTLLATPTNITSATGITLTAGTGLGNQTANITGNLSGSVGSVTGAVGSVTGAVGSVAGNVDGNVTGTVAGVTPATAAQVAALLTTQITESYRANGAAPTLAQFMSEVLAHLGESSISGTTKTINKLDHVTGAATFTLDDASTPSSITRAT